MDHDEKEREACEADPDYRAAMNTYYQGSDWRTIWPPRMTIPGILWIVTVLAFVGSGLNFAVLVRGAAIVGVYLTFVTLRHALIDRYAWKDRERDYMSRRRQLGLRVPPEYQ